MPTNDSRAPNPGLISGDDPLDFIAKNTEAKRQARLAQRDGQQTQAPVQAPQSTPTPPVAPVSEPVQAPTTPPPVEARTTPSEPLPEPDPFAESKTDEAPVEEVDEIDAEIPDVPAAENFKKVRTKLKETNKAFKEAQRLLAEKEERLKKYDTGEVISPVLEEKEQRIAQLERYEHLHNLKASPAYEATYVRPLSELETDLKEQATDYDVPFDTLMEASTLRGRERNQFLSEFFDPVGAAKVEQMFAKMDDLKRGAYEAEKEPARALERLKMEAATALAAEDRARKEKITQVTKSSWQTAISEVVKENLAPELIFNPNDEAHNETFVRPLVAQASTKYARIVRELAEQGLKDLSPELAKDLAKATLYSFATGTAVVTRQHAVDKVNELKTNMQRTKNFVRPQMGAGNGNRGNGGTRPPELTPGTMDRKAAVSNYVQQAIAKTQ